MYCIQSRGVGWLCEKFSMHCSFCVSYPQNYSMSTVVPLIREAMTQRNLFLSLVVFGVLYVEIWKLDSTLLSRIAAFLFDIIPLIYLFIYFYLILQFRLYQRECKCLEKWQKVRNSGHAIIMRCMFRNSIPLLWNEWTWSCKNLISLRCNILILYFFWLFGDLKLWEWG